MDEHGNDVRSCAKLIENYSNLGAWQHNRFDLLENLALSGKMLLNYRWIIELKAFIVHFFGFCANWLTVMMIGECFFHVFFATKSKTICTRQKARRFYALIAFSRYFVFVINLFYAKKQKFFFSNLIT